MHAIGVDKDWPRNINSQLWLSFGTYRFVTSAVLYTYWLSMCSFRHFVVTCGPRM